MDRYNAHLIEMLRCIPIKKTKKNKKKQKKNKGLLFFTEIATRLTRVFPQMKLLPPRGGLSRLISWLSIAEIESILIQLPIYPAGSHAVEIGSADRGVRNGA